MRNFLMMMTFAIVANAPASAQSDTNVTVEGFNPLYSNHSDQTSKGLEEEVVLFHDADRDQNRSLGLSETLRQIQFFTLEGLHCEAGTEDGWGAGVGPLDCGLHSSDYQLPYGQLDMTEMLRVIQFYNGGSYALDVEGTSDDGFVVKGAGGISLLASLQPDPNLDPRFLRAGKLRLAGGSRAIVSSVRSDSIALRKTVSIVDVSNPGNPLPVGTPWTDTSISMGMPTSLEVLGSFAYVGFGYIYPNPDNDIIKFNISGTSPVAIDSWDIPNVRGVDHLAIAGGRIFALVVTGGEGRLLVINDDGNDDGNPPILGSLLDDNRLGGARALHVASNLVGEKRYAYVGGGGQGGLHIYDVTDPGMGITFVGSLAGFTAPQHAVNSIEVVGDFAYLSSGYSDTIAVVDVSNRANPVLLTSFTHPDIGFPSVVKAAGNFLYVGCFGGVNFHPAEGPGHGAVVKLNITDPDDPSFDSSVVERSGYVPGLNSWERDLVGVNDIVLSASGANLFAASFWSSSFTAFATGE